MSLLRIHVTRWLDASGKRVPSTTPGAKRHRTRSRKWYARLRDPETGKVRSYPLCANKQAARQLYARLLERLERQEHGLADPEPDEPPTLPALLAEYEAHLAATGKGRSGRALRPVTLAREVGRLRLLLTTMNVVGDLTADWLRRRITELQTAGVGLPPLPAGDAFTRAEAASALGVTQDSITRAMRLGRLRASGPRGSKRYPRSALEWLRSRQMDSVRIGGQARARYARTARRLSRWLVLRGYLRRDPLLSLDAGSHPEEHLHERRSLTGEEISRLLATALVSDRLHSGLTGEDRYHLYLVALATGFRALELSALTPERFHLDADPPVALLRENEDKAGRAVEQPLPRQIVQPLRQWLASRPAGVPLWRKQALRRAAWMLREDLTEAGIPYVVEGLHGPLYADFHALRHTFVALLKRAGVPLLQAMALARHSDPKLTARVYGRLDARDLAGAVNLVALPVAVEKCTRSDGITSNGNNSPSKPSSRARRKPRS